MNKILLLLILATTSGSGFAIRPSGDRPFFSYEANAGDVLSDAAILVNSGDQPLFLEAWGSKAVTNNSLTYSLMGPEWNGGAVDWLKFPNAVYAIPARSQAELDFEIEIPADTLDGEYMAGVLAQINQPEGAEGLSLISQSGSIIAIRVGDPQTCKINIEGIATEQDGEKLGVTLALLNSGNTHFSGSGFISFERGEFLSERLIDARMFLAFDRAEINFRLFALEPGKYKVNAAMLSDKFDGCMDSFETEVMVVPPTLPNMGPPDGVPPDGVPAPRGVPVDGAPDIVETTIPQSRIINQLVNSTWLFLIFGLALAALFVAMYKRMNQMAMSADHKWFEFKKRTTKKGKR